MNDVANLVMSASIGLSRLSNPGGDFASNSHADGKNYLRMIETAQHEFPLNEGVRFLPFDANSQLESNKVLPMSKNGGLRLGTRQNHLGRFFAEWDASHSVTVGEKPTRARTYADNARLR